jgi:uncharacterized repeat protein (TIGR01451 family)
MQMQPAPQPALPPLLYVRLSGPKGMKATLYRGQEKGQSFDTPCVVGVRPGYGYRFALSDIPQFPRQVFFPTLEVRGTLLLSDKLRNADFPATLHFNEEELARVQEGALLKKVVILERPDQAFPAASKADAPLEVNVPSPRDPLLESQERGLPIVTMSLGQRQLTTEELAAQAVPGTLLLPGDKVLGWPRVAPWVTWGYCPVFDPIIGQRHPAEYVTLFDGGDSGNPAGFGQGKLRGLDPTDTVAEYTDSKGNRKLAVSNRVGLCIPRFVVYRGESGLVTQVATLGTGSTRNSQTQIVMRNNQQLVEQTQQQTIEALLSRQRASALTHTTGTQIVARMLGLELKSSLQNVEIVNGLCECPRQEAPDRPLLIIKWPDKCGANIGDTLTFHLKYSNQGGQPITDVIVSDSLTTRFEYVPGSAKTDRPATFTTQANEAGSQILRWEIQGTLQPREHGLITFQVRVR